uniref:Uncharacterized protein n=1 Tax=Coturnix japonica TaxID=93934 RepID=A0A8C2YGN9_COTJA
MSQDEGENPARNRDGLQPEPDQGEIQTKYPESYIRCLAQEQTLFQMKDSHESAMHVNEDTVSRRLGATNKTFLYFIIATLVALLVFALATIMVLVIRRTAADPATEGSTERIRKGKTPNLTGCAIHSICNANIALGSEARQLCTLHIKAFLGGKPRQRKKKGKEEENMILNYSLPQESRAWLREAQPFLNLPSGVFAGSCTCGCDGPICSRTGFKTMGDPLELVWSVSHRVTYFLPICGEKERGKI